MLSEKKQPLHQVLSHTVRTVMALAQQNDEKMIEEAIRQAMTISVFQTRDICTNSIISEFGFSEQAQVILDKIHSAIPSSDIHTDLLDSPTED